MNATALFQTGLTGVTPAEVALCMLMAFVLGKVVAFTYEWSYEGLSYSRTFVQSLVLGPMVAALLMLAIGDNLARGLGILGTMALVRFRTNVRDARDMIFVFAALAAGVACGVRAFAVCVVGVFIFGLAAMTLYWSPFARRQRFDGMLRFWLPRQAVDAETMHGVLKTHCRDYLLVALRDLGQGEAMEYAWQIRLRKRQSREALVDQLAHLPGIGGLSLLVQDSSTEI
ncbi:MAG: DUF4956 domain-containing protein [bacterium]